MNLHRFRNGMKTRGVPLNVITFAKAPAMTTEYMIIPFIMRCIKVADELSAAAVTRAIENPVPRGMRVPLKIRIKDIVYLMMVISIYGCMNSLPCAKEYRESSRQGYMCLV